MKILIKQTKECKYRMLSTLRFCDQIKRTFSFSGRKRRLNQPISKEKELKRER